MRQFELATRVSTVIRPMDILKGVLRRNLIDNFRAFVWKVALADDECEISEKLEG